ncbi:hypothetical protein [Haloferula sargassicola]|uniref:O-Antigen ligase n=1 Tax=Haloferula sargassicola TaxID=490096 RepID=A0ABP9UQ40_9BACT
MNSDRVKLVALFFFLIFGSLILGADIFAGGGNQLGRALKWCTLGAALIGLIFGRYSVLFFVVVLYYLDFVKRLLVLGDGLSLEDVMISLGSGPVIIVAACINCTVGAITGKITFGRAMDFAFYIGCVAISCLGWFVSDGSTFIQKSQDMLGTALIGMTALASYCLFRTKEDVRLLIKCMVLAGIPMALYTVWQFVYGIAAWEEAYIKTGVSTVLYNTYVVAGGINEMRPFSTLNLHPSVGAASGTMFVLSVAVMAKSKICFDRPYQRTFTYWVIGLIYLASCILCQNRTTYFLPLFYIVFAWSFRGGLRTLSVYFAGVLALTLLVLKSEAIYNNILQWSDSFENTSLGSHFGTLGTYQDRLQGFINLTDGKNWLPFGIDSEHRPWSHDPISGMIFTMGYVPFGIALMAAVIGLSWWHSKMLAIKDESTRALLIRLTAVVAALGACGVGYGNLLFVAPVNAFLGALVGVAVSCLRRELQSAPVELEAAEETASPQNLRADQGVLTRS